MNAKRMNLLASRRSQAGITLIETVMALAVLLTVSVGVMSVAIVALPATENQGHLSARATEYAQDKMEQLLALKFCDPSSDTTQFPAAAAGGSGLIVGGSLPPAAPVNQYVDYLDASGNLLGGGTTPPAGWFFQRQWQITTLPSAAMTAPCQAGTATTLVQISVAGIVRSEVGSSKIPPPQSTVVGVKSYPF
jgi:hypothetical protein